VTNFLAVLALGFFLGMRHATDPDHVVAVTTLVARHRSARRAAMIGAAWGTGHTITIVTVGGAILLLGWVIPPRVGLSLELSVAAMLVVLGAANLVSALRGARRAAAPAGAGPADERIAPGRGGFLRPFLIGLVHGLAGSAAVALLVLAAIGDPRWGVFYLLIFGAGTILGMTLITLAIAFPFRFAEGRLPGMERRIRLATGVVSVALGLFVAWQVAVGGELFGAAPVWTPE